MNAAEVQEFVEDYRDNLQDLQDTKRSSILVLAELAAEHPSAAPGIAAAICSHIQSCPPEHQLPALYLLDVLVKNHTELFVPQFAPALSETFGVVYDHADLVKRSSLSKLISTWKPFFLPSVLDATMLRTFGDAQSAHLQSQTAVNLLQQQQQQAALRASVPVSTSTAQPPLGALPPPPQTPVAHAVSNPLHSLVSSLMSQQAAMPSARPSAGVPDALLHATRFDVHTLKALQSCPAVLQRLAASTAALRPAHLDQAFLRQQRQSAAGGVLHRQWYAPLDAWLAGTVTEAKAPTGFYDEQEAERVEESVSVPADDTQPFCALSQEKFETFWDSGAQQWRYKDTCALSAEDAARYDLPEGTLVLVSCLAGQPTSPLQPSSPASTAGGEQTPTAFDDASTTPRIHIKRELADEVASGDLGPALESSSAKRLRV